MDTERNGVCKRVFVRKSELGRTNKSNMLLISSIYLSSFPQFSVLGCSATCIYYSFSDENSYGGQKMDKWIDF